MSFLRPHPVLFGIGRSRSFSAVQESFWSRYRRQLRVHPLPIWAGLMVVGYLQFRRIRQRNNAVGPDGTGEVSPVTVTIYKVLPLASISRLAGALSQVEYPSWIQSRFLNWFVNKFEVDLSEACLECVNDYPSFAQFFARRLKEDARPIDKKALLVSPSDGKVLSCGPVDPYGYLEQVKGTSYPLRDFIGPFIQNNNTPKNLQQITIYLAPGNYHHFHSPTEWKVSERRHFRGKLLSVGDWASHVVPRLFVKNERVVYLGAWTGGLFSMTAVGATNVGSIKIDFDESLATNQGSYSPSCNCNELHFEKKPSLGKGDHFGQFNFGSTIILVFEAPKNFKFSVTPGQDVRVGMAL